MPDILVIGLNSLGQTLARELSLRGANVTVADRDEGRIKRIMSSVREALALDTTNRLALERLDVPHFDNVVVCMGHEFEEAELTTLALRDLDARHITAMATTRQRKQILETIGANYVMTPGLQQARDLAMRLTEEPFRTFRYINDDQGVAEVVNPANLEIDGEFEAAIAKFEVRLVGVLRRDSEDGIFESRFAEPKRVQTGDTLLFFGRPEDIARVVKKKLR